MVGVDDDDVMGKLCVPSIIIRAFELTYARMPGIQPPEPAVVKKIPEKAINFPLIENCQGPKNKEKKKRSQTCISPCRWTSIASDK